MFGENYIQESKEKFNTISNPPAFHFIGHLQSNKVKYLAPFVYLLLGVDSLKLLGVVDREAEKNERVIDCLLEIRIAREETKFGLPEKEVTALLDSDAFREMKQ